MKTFLNVLYRRILYKIPLKFLLILLAIVAVCIASVNAGYTTNTFGNLNLYGGQTFVVGQGESKFYSLDTFCMFNGSSTACNMTATQGNKTVSISNTRDVACLTGVVFSANNGVSVKNNSSSQCLAYNIAFTSDIYPNYTSLQCQTEYNLIPISSVDQNYCTTNNLCPACETCPVCPVGSGSISTLYINDILHVGAPFIYLDIPEEIGWDYGYTQGGTNMLIDVEGYNVDYEAMQSVIDQQNYKPTQEDFQNIIALLGPYGEIIIFFVFLFILWAWIKKPFKSKL